MTLSVPTIYLVIALNLLAIGIVWTFVARCYPKFPAAVVWAVGCTLGAAGAAMSLLRGSVDPLVPIVTGNVLLSLMTWFGWFGLRMFYQRRVPWLLGAAGTVATAIVLMLLAVWDDTMRMRIVVFSIGQSIPVTLMLVEIAGRRREHRNGADLAIGALCVVLALFAARSIASITHIGGDITLREFNTLQGAFMVMLVFSAMVGNFALLLMTVERLRNDVAVLALSDDLTGIANRRHLLKRLSDECALSHRTQAPFAILVMDLDEFKIINDSYGHGAGDECLRVFSRIVQSRLRSSDLLARIGGDEFCVVLPMTGAREASLVAGDLVAICSRTQVRWNGVAISLSASIGVAQWTPAVNDTPEQMIAAADQALYDAKRHGKDRHALHRDDSQPPSAETAPAPPSPVPHLRSA